MESNGIKEALILKNWWKEDLSAIWATKNDLLSTGKLYNETKAQKRDMVPGKRSVEEEKICVDIASTDDEVEDLGSRTAGRSSRINKCGKEF